MASFSVSDAAFAGFRLVKERPKAFGVWVAINSAMSLGFSMFTMAKIMPAVAQLQQAGRQASPDPTASLHALQSVLPLYGLLVLFSLAFYPVVYAAMDRAVLRPADDAFGYLRLGADELRQFLLMLLYIAVMLGLYLGAGIVFVIISVGVGASVGLAAKGGGTAGAALFGLIGFVAFLGIFVGIAYFAARFSLASPLTFDKQRVDLFGSWKLTKGKVWALVGTALLVLILTLIIYLATLLLVAAFSAIPGLKSSYFQMIFRPDPNALSAGLTPGLIVSQLVLAAMNSFLIPLWLTPPAAIYRSLTGGTRDTAVAEVFS